MEWNVAEAKRRLSELLRAAASEPQLVKSRDRAVAAVVGVEEYEQFAAWRAGRQSIGTAFDDLRRLAAEEGWTLPRVRRAERRNAFARALGHRAR